MKKNIKFKNVEISVICANGEVHTYYKNNNYKKYTEQEIAELFNLKPFHYATELDGVDTTFKSFNTYNWGAPFTFCGVHGEDIYDGIAIVNIHLGGDARGNYSEPYICEEVDAILSQSTFLDIELTNGEIYSFDCDNSESYFDFDTLDPYYIDFEEPLSKKQYKEIKDKKNN